jgi:uncharacterized membrane protein
MVSTPPSRLPPEAPERLAAPSRASELAEARPSALLLLLNDHAWQIFLGLALVINIALFIFLAVRFESLPDLLPLHFDVSGLPDRIEAKQGIFGLPIIGLMVLLTNTLFEVIVHRHQRAVTLLLAVSALLVQILMWLAVNNIIGGLV